MKKFGCLKGCLTGLVLVLIFFTALTFSIIYGFKSNWTTQLTDPAVKLAYKQVVKPKALDLLKSFAPKQNKDKVEQLMDSGLEKYLQLPPDIKNEIFKEAVVASYYYARSKPINPEKFPRLMKFGREHYQSFQQEQKANTPSIPVPSEEIANPE